MIVAFDIETIPNPEAVALLPDPYPGSRLKDPAKIADSVAEKKAKQAEDAALDPLTGRIAAYAMVKVASPDPIEFVRVVEDTTDAHETELVESILAVLGAPDTRIVTWNGIGFDLPYVYKRAMLLGINLAPFGVPPLPAWTKRYAAERHYDLMQIWGGWSSQGFVGLDLVAQLVLGERKTEFDVKLIATLLKTAEGRAKVGEYCLQDTRLTARLWSRFNGVFFA